MKTYKIVKDQAKLRNPCAPCRSVEEGKRIGEILKVILERSQDAIGLAANQIGINQRVCIINVKKPILLVNPRIVNKFDKFFYKEGCLSFPGDYVTTVRYKNIMVQADNHKKMLVFSSDTQEDMLECACVQHEIDHLDGLVMFDRAPSLAQPKATDLLIKGIKNGK
jgi:peptide deformylase